MNQVPTQKRNIREAIDDYQELRAKYARSNADEWALHQPTIVSRYYDVVTKFYQLSWGTSFHFAPRVSGETLSQAIKRQEEGLAGLLHLRPDMHVADIGCGIGGPLINIARFSGAKLTGINISEHQINRGRELVVNAGLNESCEFLHADFTEVPLPDNCFDAVYSIEALCHSPDRLRTFQELFRLIKPAGEIAILDWCLTDTYDDEDSIHRDVRSRIEYANSLAPLISGRELARVMEAAGFELLSSYDQNSDSETKTPWYMSLQGRDISLTSFARTPFGREFTRHLTKILEFLRIAPNGTSTTSEMLNIAADSLVKGGELGIFTPSYLIHARKPA